MELNEVDLTCRPMTARRRKERRTDELRHRQQHRSATHISTITWKGRIVDQTSSSDVTGSELSTTLMFPLRFYLLGIV
jgi:hypothetical protein